MPKAQYPEMHSKAFKKKYTLAKEPDKRDKAAQITLHKLKLHQQNQILLTGGVPVTEESGSLAGRS